LAAACTIDPRYADAHFNLAVVFATLDPPRKDKAREYYQRATTLGADRDNSLEQMLK
jgi:Tfp pilus assembly protein PilF